MIVVPVSKGYRPSLRFEVFDVLEFDECEVCACVRAAAAAAARVAWHGSSMSGAVMAYGSSMTG